MGMGSPKPRRKASSRPASPPRPSLLLATRRIRAWLLRIARAKLWSSGVSPALASTSSSTASASATACSVWARMRAASASPRTSSFPAVATTVKVRSPSRPWPSRRSRVTPGVSSTMARRRPTSRLNRVDLPVFGRPTIARVKAMSWTSAQGDQIGVVRQDKERALGDDRRQMGRRGQRDLSQKLARIGRYGKSRAVGTGQDQAIAGQDRSMPEDRLGWIRRIGIFGQLAHPADLAVLAREAEQLLIRGQHIDIVAGDPGRLAAAEIRIPDARARLQVEGGDGAAVADGDGGIAIDDGAAADIRQRRDGAAADLAGEGVAPQSAARIRAQAIDLAGAIDHDDLVFGDRGRGRAEQAGRFVEAVMAPQPPAVIRGEGHQIVVDAHDEDPAVGDGGAGAHRTAHGLPPDLLARARIEGDHVAEGGGDEDPAAVIGNAPAQ